MTDSMGGLEMRVICVLISPLTWFIETAVKLTVKLVAEVFTPLISTMTVNPVD